MSIEALVSFYSPGKEQTGHEEGNNRLENLVTSSNWKLSNHFLFASFKLSNENGTEGSNAAHCVVSIIVPVVISRVNLTLFLNVFDLSHSQKGSRDVKNEEENGQTNEGTFGYSLTSKHFYF